MCIRDSGKGTIGYGIGKSGEVPEAIRKGEAAAKKNMHKVAMKGTTCLLYTSYIKRGGKVWIKIFPDKPVTEKPAETRMGSGKGSPEYWVAVVKRCV